MNYKKIISFVVFFFLKEILSSKSEYSSQQYNITKLVDEWFSKIFQVNLGMTKELREAFGFSVNCKLAYFEYNFNREVKPFKNKFIFQDVTFYRHSKDESGTSRISKMNFNFVENKISVTMKKLRITLEAELRAQCHTPFLTIFTTLNFRNFTLTATKRSGSDHTSIDMLYDRFFKLHYGLNVNIKWSGEQADQLLATEKDQLAKEITPAIVAMLRAHINQNHHFSNGFSTLFNTISNIKTDIVSTNPDILYRGKKYYYYIPQIPFHNLTLNEIQIQGLPNIRSLDVYRKSHNFTKKLLVKDIQGSMILNFGSLQGLPEPLKIGIEMDHLAISTQEKKKYDRQVTSFKQAIESAILSSIVSSTKDSWDWNTINETHKDWIPFKDVKNSTRSKIRIRAI